jgi:hypothetical protein
MPYPGYPFHHHRGQQATKEYAMLTTAVRLLGAGSMLLALWAVLVLGGGAGEGLDDLFGAKDYKGCQNCQDKDLTFFECLHFNPPGDTTCQTDRCIENFTAWFECSPTPKEGKDSCEAKAVEGAIWRAQKLRKAKGLTCKDDGFVPVPGTPAKSDCVPYPNAGGQPRGKCFLDSCNGELIEEGRTFKGLVKCAK